LPSEPPARSRPACSAADPSQAARLRDLTPTVGQALVGHFLKTLAPALANVDAALPARTGVATSGIVRSHLCLLVHGKSEFDAIENLRGDKSFKQALGIGLLPSSPKQGQRMDVMNNSGTAKEGVGRTYAGVDGYWPLAAGRWPLAAGRWPLAA